MATEESKEFTNIASEGIAIEEKPADDVSDGVAAMISAAVTKQTETSCPVTVKIEKVDEYSATVDKSVTVETSADKESLSEDKTVKVETVTADETAEVDEYSYTKRDGFTSEIYKLCISNIPKNFGFKEFRKKLMQLDLKPVKIKQWKDIVFVTFRCEEDKAVAMKTLNGYTYKGKALEAAHAKPAADPLMRKRKQEQSEGHGDEKKFRTDEDDTPPEIRLKNSVTPLWKLTYEEQLQKKQEEMRQMMKKFYNLLEKNCHDLKHWLRDKKRDIGYPLPVELLDIVASPETEKYRNKCEFTIGPGVDGSGTVVGFRFGTYSQGTVCVGSPLDVPFLSDAMGIVVKCFQTYLTDSEYRGFNPEDHTGHWRQLSVRTSRLGHVMAMVDFHPQSLTQDTIAAEESKLKEYFMTGNGRDAGITSFFFRCNTEKMTGGPSDTPYKLLFGDDHITESLLDMKFQISPNAFFQVNTAAAEVLYKQVRDWASVTPNSVLLDVCCGTGTIGLTVAKSVQKVIGIEMCAQAIEDAKVNAKLNDVTNVTYHCAKAEDVMANITRSLGSQEEVVAIVDPPRGGLHTSVVLAIRNCRPIKKLVYVSCNINGALNNMIDLVRPLSKRLKGPRFYPVKAVPVDLFPHTNHCELVMLFEREQDTG